MTANGAVRWKFEENIYIYIYTRFLIALRAILRIFGVLRPIFDPGTPLEMFGTPLRFIWTEFQPVISYGGPKSAKFYLFRPPGRR